MSIVRRVFSGSDLYIYEGEQLVCDDCPLQPGGAGNGADHEEPTGYIMGLHVLEHVAAGHRVPAYVLANCWHYDLAPWGPKLLGAGILPS